MTGSSTQPGSSSSLQANALSVGEVMVASLSQMGPAFSLVFVFTVLSATVGSAIPFIFIITMVGILTVGNSLAQFSRIWPSAGSFVTFISRSIGPKTALFLAVVGLAGGAMLLGGQFLFLGNYLRTEIFHMSSPAMDAVFTLLVAALVVVPVSLGVSIGARVALVLYLFEMAVMIAIAIYAIAQARPEEGYLHPFDPSGNSLGSLGLAMSLAILCFIGFESCVPLAEETRDPKRSIPRALYGGIIITGVAYIFCAYGLSLVFDTPEALGDQSPFVEVAKQFAPWLLIPALWMVVSSTGASMIATNTQYARVTYSGARAGLWSSSLAVVSPRFKTPVHAIITFAAAPLAIMLVSLTWWDGLTASGYWSNLGVMGVLAYYVACNIGLIIHYFKRKPGEDRGHVFTWVVVPLIGSAVLVYPIWGLVDPSQPAPANMLWIAVAVLAVAATLFTVNIVKNRPQDIGRASNIMMGEEEVAPLS